MNKRWFAVLLVFLGLAFAGTAALKSQGYFAVSGNPALDAQPNFQLMAEAWNLVQKFYVDQSAFKSKELTYGAINGMVSALGDSGHTSFLTPEMVKQEQEYISGHYKGIGVQIRAKDGHVVIIAPIDGSPAQKAGLKSGDIIARVDGKDATDVGLAKVGTWIQGPVNTNVTLTIEDPQSGDTRDVTLTRTSITVQNVRWQMLPDSRMAHLRIAGFSRGVGKNFRKMLQEIKSNNMQGIVLDLRNDPGGVLDEAVDCTSQFLGSGNVLLQKDAQGKLAPVAVRPGGIATDMPLVILINRGTASASEVMAGALQDARRAQIVGETSFGTGTVLAQFPLSDGSALLIAVREWLTPNGNEIWHKGIVPDVAVATSKDFVPTIPEELRNMSIAQLRATGDAQLLQAMKVLNGEAAHEEKPLQKAANR